MSWEILLTLSAVTVLVFSLDTASQEIDTSSETYKQNNALLHPIPTTESDILKMHIAEDRQTPDMQDTAGRKRVKIKFKKKYKKMFMKIAMIGILIKSALLPLAVGALKILTGKAFLMTMMALGLALAITFRTAKEKHVTTEIINLVPPLGKHRSFPDSLPTFFSSLENHINAGS